MTTPVSERIERWLDEAATSMGGHARHRRDVLMELEATIQERVDERHNSGQVPDEAVQDVLDLMGDPTEVGASFAPVRPLLAPHQTRPFIVNVMVLFAVHFTLVVAASVAGQGLAVYPFRIAPMANPGNFVELLVRALRTLMFDIGAVLCLFAFIPRLGRILRFPRASLAVRPDVRRCVESAFFLALVLVVVNFVRESLLALYLNVDGKTVLVPLVGPGVTQNLLSLNVWLGLAIARELLYARFGERMGTLGVDVVATVAGIFCLLRIATTKQLVDLSQATEALGEAAETLGAVLNTAFGLIAMATAALLAARLMRRAFRLILLWR